VCRAQEGAIILRLHRRRFECVILQEVSRKERREGGKTIRLSRLTVLGGLRFMKDRREPKGEPERDRSRGFAAQKEKGPRGEVIRSSR